MHQHAHSHLLSSAVILGLCSRIFKTCYVGMGKRRKAAVLMMQNESKYTKKTRFEFYLEKKISRKRSRAPAGNNPKATTVATGSLQTPDTRTRTAGSFPRGCFSASPVQGGERGRPSTRC